MIAAERFALNRVAAPGLPLAEFYRLARAAGLAKVELRNDLGGADPVDGLPPKEAAALAKGLGIEVLTVNAVQKFNLASARAGAAAELERLLGLAKALPCPALVLCPNNAAEDARGPAERFAETVEALAAFGPAFEGAGVLGYVEPLGFSISSLDSLLRAREAIGKSGFGCYRLVLDSFHRYIGPEEPGILGKGLPVECIGLVHLSGLELELPRAAYRDGHRVLVGPRDRSGCRSLLRRLEEEGYRGPYSFEPFSPEIQGLSPPALAAALRESLDYLRG